MEQCTFCESLYDVEESDSNMKKCFCSITCEMEFQEYQEVLEDLLE